MAMIEPTTHTVRAKALSAPFSVDDLLEIPDDGHRYELFNGSLVVSPAPTPLHQDTIFALQTILHQAKPSHLKVYATVNVRASEHDFYIPDLVVVPKVAARSARLMFRPSDVLLAVEVVSPTTKVQDRKLKPEAYAAAGIPSYWRFESSPGPELHVHELDGGAYTEPSVYKGGTTVTLTTPYTVSFDPADLIDLD
ncbi:Uma2 family endonuclease [[Actinomadura] parvosata]|uniref:Uma2 family endonuclease n=1 Tax=[Actinomadura] parvosata TaxID=1955412 RepID=UPI00406CB588